MSRDFSASVWYGVLFMPLKRKSNDKLNKNICGMYNAKVFNGINTTTHVL